ncbi:hypothetical protein Tco_0150192 [Tanacetum coccineum]
MISRVAYSTSSCKEALEQSFSLLEFRGFSSFDRWKLVEVGNGVKSVTRPFTLAFESEDSFTGERNHHMVHKLEVIGQRIRVIGLNVLEESSKKHGIRESHFTTLGHTYHSMSNVVGKIEGLPIGEAIKHITQACVRMIFVSAEAYDIFTNNDFPFFEHFFHFGANHLEWIEGDIDTFAFLEFGFGSFMEQCITNHGWFFVRRRDEDGTNLFVNVKKAIEANCRKGVAKIRFIFEKVRKDDTTFMEEASHERLVDLPFMTSEASGVLPWGEPVKDLWEKEDES